MAPSRLSPPPETLLPPTNLTAEQLASFQRDGYLLLPHALPPATVSALLAETNRLLTSFPLTSHPMTRFSTGENETAHVGDDYFLTSGDKIRFFFEEDAFSPSSSSTTGGGSQLTKPKHRAINKIGHYLHELSPPFRAATFTPLHRSIARAVGFRDPRVLQSMVICKQPEIGGRVPPHQDSTFLYTDPPSAVGFWIALEDATRENGCLSFVRGSHRRVPVRSRFVRKEGGGTGFDDNVAGAEFPADMTEVDDEEEKEEEEEEEEGDADDLYEFGEVEAGTLVLIHGNLLHKSERNSSGKSRFIYTFHVIEGENDYDGRNWLQPPPDKGFTKLYETEAS